jgi:hypothetical protein
MCPVLSVTHVPGSYPLVLYPNGVMEQSPGFAEVTRKRDKAYPGWTAHP